VPPSKRTDAYKNTKYEDVPERIRSKNRENLVLFNGKKEFIATFEGTKQGARIPPEMLGQIGPMLQGGFAVHNHPRSGPVSDADLNFTNFYRLTEHVIVTKTSNIKLSAAGLTNQIVEVVKRDLLSKLKEAESLARTAGLDGAQRSEFIREKIHSWYRMMGISIEEEYK
jgi:hypothetical protein